MHPAPGSVPVLGRCSVTPVNQLVLRDGDIPILLQNHEVWWRAGRSLVSPTVSAQHLAWGPP